MLSVIWNTPKNVYTCFRAKKADRCGIKKLKQFKTEYAHVEIRVNKYKHV